MDKEAIARIIYAPNKVALANWDEAVAFAAKFPRSSTARCVREAYAKATAILALQSSERGEGIERHRKALGKLEDALEDQDAFYSAFVHIAWNAVSETLATLSPAEPSPESREGVEYPVEERAFHVVRASPDEPDEHFRAKDRATLSSFPAPSRENAYAMADSLNQIVRFHVEAAIRALSAPAHD